MTIAEALTQLRAWCDRSRGEPIEIAPGNTGTFQSRGPYAEAAVREIEEDLQFKLPAAYYDFMAVIGESSLFGYWYFYDPRQVIDVSHQWAAAQGNRIKPSGPLFG